MGANVGPNVGASNFVSEIIRKIADESDNGFVCKSTEEMLYKFDKYNKERTISQARSKKLIIGSMDIEKWYNNTIPVPTAKSIKKMFIESELQIKGINYDKVAKYLGKYLTREQILEENFEEILYIKEGKMKEKEKRKYNKNKNKKKEKNKKQKTLNTADGGLALDINKGGGQKQKTLNTAGGGLALDTNKSGGKNKYKKKKEIKKKVKNVYKRKNEKGNKEIKKKEILKPKREPNEIEKRNMLGRAIELLIVTTTTNHVYKFGNRYMVQAKDVLLVYWRDGRC